MNDDHVVRLVERNLRCVIDLLDLKRFMEQAGDGRGGRAHGNLFDCCLN